MNNRKSSYTKKEDDQIMEGLASRPPAELGVVDKWMDDADTLRIAGKIALSEPDIRRLLVTTPEFQQWVNQASRTDRDRLPVRDMDEKGLHN